MTLRRSVAAPRPQARMRAGVIIGARRFEVASALRPDPGPDQVRIRLEGCGVCGSNVPVWEGRPWFGYPLEPGSPGHEGWGVVDAIGERVTTLEIGQRVAAVTYRAFADCDIADVDAVVPLPKEMHRVPFPGEPLACAMNVFRRCEIKAGHTVAIVGIGFLGALLTRLATRAGARVIAISRRPFALGIARTMGAEATLSMDNRGEVQRIVHDWTLGNGCDRVIEAVGLQEPLDLAGELTRERGRLVIAGYHQDGARRINMQLWNWRGLDVINAHERDPAIYRRGLQDAIAAVRNGIIDPMPLYTHRFPLEQAGTALESASRRPDGFLKALVLT